MKSLVLLLLSADRRRLAAAVGVAVASGLATAGLVALLASAVGRADPGGWPLAVGFLFIAALTVAARIVSQLLLIDLAQSTVFGLRMRLCREILAAPLSHLEACGPAKLLTTLQEDVQAVTDAAQGIPFLCFNLATLVGCGLYLLWLAPTVLLASLVIVFPGVLAYRAVEQQALAALRSARDRHDSLTGYFRAVIDGIKELKLHAQRRQAFFEQALEATSAASRRDMYRGLALYSLGGAWTQMLLMLLLGLLLFVVPRVISLAPGQLAAFVLTVLYLLRPVDFVLHIMPIVGRAGVSMKKIESLGISLEQVVESMPPGSGPTELQTLVLRGVVRRFGLPGSDDFFQLGPIDLELHPGQVLLVTGGNGSGKSTLGKVLVGLYPPDSGEIVWNGRPVDELGREAYRQLFSAIFSDFFLFDRWYGIDPGRSAATAAQYLERLHLAQKVRLDEAGPRSLALSHGQRKRLALLAAYLEDRPVYVFDEWAADQDPSFKEIFYRQLVPELSRRGKAVVVISHDDRYFDAADERVRLDEGRLVV